MSTTRSDNRPAFQFYPDDWLTDNGLQLCSLAAQGLWAHLICRMWTSPIRGELRTPQSSRAQSDNIAKWTGTPQAEVKQLLSELKRYGVCSTTAGGVIYNRRMVRDEKQRQSKAEAGRAGGKVSKRQAKRGSSSSPSSSTPYNSPPLPPAGGSDSKREKPKTKAVKKTPKPDDHDWPGQWSEQAWQAMVKATPKTWREKLLLRHADILSAAPEPAKALATILDVQRADDKPKDANEAMRRLLHRLRTRLVPSDGHYDEAKRLLRKEAE